MGIYNNTHLRTMKDRNMKIIKELPHKTFYMNKITKHGENRLYRQLDTLILYTTFLVDNNHGKGREYHYLFSNGKIVITNVETNNLITILNARPRQLYRYWLPNDSIFKQMERGAKLNVRDKINY